MSQSIVRLAMQAKLNTWAQAQTPPLQIAWENNQFTPPAGRYARAFLIPSPTVSQTLARNHKRYQGILQISLYMPPNTGPTNGEALVASLETEFNPANLIVSSMNRIYILQPASAAPALQSGDRYVIPVSVPYELHVV